MGMAIKEFVPMTDEQIAHEERMDELARELEKKHPRVRMKTEELKEIFPEILEIAPARVRELQSRIESLTSIYKRIPVDTNTLEGLWEQDRREEEMKELKKQLVRFSRFVPQAHSYGLSDAQIEDAMEYPITDLVDHGRRSGNTVKVLCPMHDERTPSCVIYLDKNNFWCFGCNNGGNVINFLMARDDIDFVTAVKTLTGSIS